jgi:hypothetical protein
MKRFIIAAIFSIIIILLPISSSIETEFSENREEDIRVFSALKIKLNDETIDQIYKIASEIENGIYRYKALSIINQILTEYGELNVNKFFNILNKEDITDFNEIRTTTDVLDDLYNFIFGLIVERLGWVNDLLDKTSNIINDARNLWNDRTIPSEIRYEIQNIINKFNELKNLTTLLSEGEYFQFLRNWTPFIFINDTMAIIESIQTIAYDLGILFGDIQSFIYDVSDFMSWFGNEPWKDQIYVYGRVIEGINGVSNATVSCMNITTQTDEYGNFSMYIPSNPSEFSVPPNEYYGIHKCIITAEKNGVMKNSIDTLSYVFSGGSIFWMFIMTDEEFKSIEFDYYFHKLFGNNPNLHFLMKILIN